MCFVFLSTRRLAYAGIDLFDSYHAIQETHTHVWIDLFLNTTSNWFLVYSSTSSGKRTSRSNSWCDKAPGLSESQRKLCKRVPGLQIAIKKGIEKGISECEREFKWNRWNCTLLGEKSLLQRAPGESLKAVVKQLNPVYINSKICFHRQL